MLVTIEKNKQGLLEISPMEGKQSHLLVATAEKVYLNNATKYDDVIVGNIQASWGLDISEYADTRTRKALIGSRPFLYKGMKPVSFDRFERASRLIIGEKGLLANT